MAFVIRPRTLSAALLMVTTDAAVRSRKNQLGLLALVLIAIGFSAVPVMSSFSRPESNKDYSRWWNAAMDVRHGAPLLLANGEQSYIYPPAGAVLFYTPLSYLGVTGMVLALCVLNLAAHLCVTLLSVHWATGKCLNQHPLLYLVPVGVTLPYVWDTYYLGQPNLVLLAAMMLGLRLLDRHRRAASGWAGMIFAAATVAKAFPAMVIGSLVWRRHWIAAGTMVLGTLVLLLILPAPVRGFAENARETWVWIDRMILSTSGESLANQPNRAFRSGNQSMVSVVHRLTRPIDAQPEGVDAFRVNVASLTPRAAFALFAGIALSLCVVYVAAMPPRGLRTRRTNGLEYAILLILIAVFSPKAGTYYSCWALPGVTMLTAEVLRAPRGSSRRFVLLSGLILSVIVMASALAQVLDVFTPQALGATFWGSFLLALLLLESLRMESRRLIDGSRMEEDNGDLAPYLAGIPGVGELPDRSGAIGE